MHKEERLRLRWAPASPGPRHVFHNLPPAHLAECPSKPAPGKDVPCLRDLPGWEQDRATLSQLMTKSPLNQSVEVIHQNSAPQGDPTPVFSVQREASHEPEVTPLQASAPCRGHLPRGPSGLWGRSRSRIQVPYLLQLPLCLSA